MLIYGSLPTVIFWILDEKYCDVFDMNIVRKISFMFTVSKQISRYFPWATLTCLTTLLTWKYCCLENIVYLFFLQCLLGIQITKRTSDILEIFFQSAPSLYRTEPVIIAHYSSVLMVILYSVQKRSWLVSVWIAVCKLWRWPKCPSVSILIVQLCA